MNCKNISSNLFLFLKKLKKKFSFHVRSVVVAASSILKLFLAVFFLDTIGIGVLSFAAFIAAFGLGFGQGLSSVGKIVGLFF